MRWAAFYWATEVAGFFLHPLLEPCMRLHERIRRQQGWEWSYISTAYRPSIRYHLRPPL